MTDREKNGAALKKRRLACEGKPSQEQIAALVGVPVGTYVNWERGRSMPPTLSRKRLEEVFLAIEQGKDLKLGVTVSDETFNMLRARAKKEGKTVEEIAGKILRQIFGLLILSLILGVTCSKDVVFSEWNGQCNSQSEPRFFASRLWRKATSMGGVGRISCMQIRHFRKAVA